MDESAKQLARITFSILVGIMIGILIVAIIWLYLLGRHQRAERRRRAATDDDQVDWNRHQQAGPSSPPGAIASHLARQPFRRVAQRRVRFAEDASRHRSQSPTAIMVSDLEPSAEVEAPAASRSQSTQTECMCHGPESSKFLLKCQNIHVHSVPKVDEYPLE